MVSPFLFSEEQMSKPKRRTSDNDKSVYHYAIQLASQIIETVREFQATCDEDKSELIPRAMLLVAYNDQQLAHEFVTLASDKGYIAIRKAIGQTQSIPVWIRTAFSNLPPDTA